VTAEAPELATLFRQANAGDSVAYRSLLLRLTPWLRGFVRKGLVRAGRSSDESEDIVQEALLALHLKRHTWDDRQPLEPWVRAIAHHKLIDALRRRGNRAQLDIADVADELPFEEKVDVGDIIDRERLMQCLPERQQRIVEAISIMGLSAREAADKLGMSEGAVRVALHRALKLMADRAREYEK
jgi:RNA polymerase sigma-70 factor (ECF subfamily)